jgi:hypothetical protein
MKPTGVAAKWSPGLSIDPEQDAPQSFIVISLATIG